MVYFSVHVTHTDSFYNKEKMVLGVKMMKKTIFF